MPAESAEPLTGAATCALHVDALLSAGERLFQVRGWAFGARAGAARLTAISPEGERVALGDAIVRHPRPDVEAAYPAAAAEPDGAGFLGSFRLEAPSRVAAGWMVEMETARDRAVGTDAPPALHDPVAVRDGFLAAGAAPANSGAEAMMRAVPAIAEAQEIVAGEASIESIEQFGQPPERPGATVVVHGLARGEAVEQQLAQFAEDPELAAADVIFVLDSRYDDAKPPTFDGNSLERLYRIPFRTVWLSRPTGPVAACNLAARLGRGRLLVLLDAGVIAPRPGWIGALARTLDERQDAGAAVPNVRSAGGSTEHADGECLLVTLDVYRRLGGLRSACIGASAAFADYHLRLAAAGRSTRYVPDAELERVRAEGERTLWHAAARYDACLLRALWDETLADRA